MATVLHPNIIMEEFDDQAIYEIYYIPRAGSLYLQSEDGLTSTKLESNSRFTQADIRANRLTYSSAVSPNARGVILRDYFYFRLIDPTTGKPFRVTKWTNGCVVKPPLKSSYRFDINIITLPKPVRHPTTKSNGSNAFLIYENAEHILTLADVAMWVDPTLYNTYINPPLPPAPPFPETGWEYYPVEYVWKKSTGNNNYTVLMDDVEIVPEVTKFNNEDVKAGRIKIRALEQGSSSNVLTLICSIVGKPQKWSYGGCRFYINQMPFALLNPGAVGELWECSEPRAVLPGELDFITKALTPEANSNPNQITCTFDSSSSTGTSGLLRISPETFTVAQAQAGEVQIWHECSAAPKARFDVYDRITLSVCTHFGQCKNVSRTFKILSYLPPTLIVDPTTRSSGDINPYMTGRTMTFKVKVEMKRMTPADVTIAIDLDKIADKPDTDPIKRLSWNMTEFTQAQVNAGVVKMTDNGSQVTRIFKWGKDYTKRNPPAYYFKWVVQVTDFYTISLPVIVTNSQGLSTPMTIPFTVRFSPENIASALVIQTPKPYDPYGA